MMDYSELKQIAETKKIEVREIANQLEMTSNGFRESIKNETIQLKKLRQLCEILNISPAKFFDVNQFGIISKNVDLGSKQLIDSRDREIEMLKQRLNDKEEIIKLLRERNSLTHGYGIASEPK